MLKKHKMLFEFVANKETEEGAVPIETSIGLADDLGKIAKKYKFMGYCKDYPKEVVDYKPTNKTYKLETIGDISQLTAEQFEMFIGDLRQYVEYDRGLEKLREMGFKIKKENSMTRLDTGLHTAEIKVEMSVKNTF